MPTNPKITLNKSDFHSGNERIAFYLEELFYTDCIYTFFLSCFVFESSSLSLEYVSTGYSLNSDYVQARMFNSAS